MLGSNTVQNRQAVEDALNSLQPSYRVYSALLTQTGTASPTAIVLENTLGEVPTFSRNDAGDYSFSATFAQNDTFVTLTNNNGAYIFYTQIGDNSIGIFTTDLLESLTDGILNKTPFEVRVYN